MLHEFSITSQIVEKVLQEADKKGARKVLQVHLVIGMLTFLGIEQIRFAYGILVKDTIMEGSKLYIEERNGLVKCMNCGYEGPFGYEDDPTYHIQTPTLHCPKCRCILRIVGGRDCMIKSLRLVI